MNAHHMLSAAIAVLAGIALAGNPALAREHSWSDPDSSDHQSFSHHERSSGPSHERAAPSFQSSGPREFSRTPPRDFRGVPPSFNERSASRDFRGPDRTLADRNFGRDFDRSRLNERSRDFDRPQRDFGNRPSHGSLQGPSQNVRPSFQGNFRNFTSVQQQQWRSGHWHHGSHHGQFGWWFICNGWWFFYNYPIYPYPLFVSYTYYYDYPSYASDYYWYWCDNPRGYYPYVRECYGPWIPVSPNSGYNNSYGYGSDGYGPGGYGQDGYGQDGYGPDGYGPDGY